MSQDVYRIARDHGFHREETVTAADNGRPITDLREMACKLALIHSEASEALEELRKTPFDRDAWGEELADIIIRVGDLAHISGVNLEKAVEDKIWKNRSREYQHGGRTL